MGRGKSKAGAEIGMLKNAHLLIYEHRKKEEKYSSRRRPAACRTCGEEPAGHHHVCIVREFRAVISHSLLKASSYLTGSNRICSSSRSEYY